MKHYCYCWRQSALLNGLWCHTQRTKSAILRGFECELSSVVYLRHWLINILNPEENAQMYWIRTEKGNRSYNSMPTVSGYRVWSVYGACVVCTTNLGEPTWAWSRVGEGQQATLHGLERVLAPSSVRGGFNLAALRQLDFPSFGRRLQWLEKRTRETFVFLDHLDFSSFPSSDPREICN